MSTQKGVVMPEHFILLASESFRRKTKKTAERKRIFAECLTEDWNFLKKRSVQTIQMMREKGYDGKMDSHTAYYERNMLIHAHHYYWGTEEQRREIDNRRHKHRKGEYLGINCLLDDGFQTGTDIEAKMRDLIPPLPEPEALTIEEKYTDEQGTGKKSESVAVQMPLDQLADALQDTVEAGRHLYYAVEDAREEMAELEKRITASEKENKFLKQKLGECEQRLTEIENALTTDPTQLAAIQAAAKRLKRDVIEGMPQYTEIGRYWKEILPTVYRKRFKKSLRDKGIQQERDAIEETIKRIMIDPFYPGLETEIRKNGDNGDASMIAGIARGAPYYYSRVGVHRRLIWLVEERRVHFVETGTKETYTYA